MPSVPGVTMKSMFGLGLPVPEPWAYQHTLGVSLNDIEGWWKQSLPTLKQDLKNVATNLPNQQAATPAPMPPPTIAPPSSSGPDGTTILIAVVLLGGAAGGYYYWQKSKKKNGKAAKA